MNRRCPRSRFSRPVSPLLNGVLMGLMAFVPGSLAQQLQTNTVLVKNWPLPKASVQTSEVGTGSTSGLVFISITPCRVLDTRAQGGSNLTGAFGPPSLVAGQARSIPIPQSSCGVPVAAAYSMNFVSITPAGQAVAWIAAWQDNIAWPGTVVLNALLGGVVDNSAVVPAGTDGGIQVLSTSNGDLVIDMNGYYVDATTIEGPSGPPGTSGPAGPSGPTGASGQTGATGATGGAG